MANSESIVKSKTSNVKLDWESVSSDIEIFQSRIGALEIDEDQREYLIHRWLARLVQIKRRSNRVRYYYYSVKLIAIAGGLLIPAIVSAKFFSDQGRHFIDITVFGLSLLVALATGIDGFFRFGDQWRLCRRTVYELEQSGWNYFTLSAWVFKYKSHKNAHRHFVEHTEAILEEYGSEMLSWFSVSQQKKGNVPGSDD